MSRHPVTTQIDAAIDLLERHGEPVTPEAVKRNVTPRLTWADWSPNEAADEALDRRIPRRMKERGYIIADSVSRERKDFWRSTVAELEEQIRIKKESSRFDVNRLRADEAIVAFLKEQEQAFGYEVYPGLFHADIDRIYRMHGIAIPRVAA